MDEIKLKYFASVARHLSFTKAAEDLHVVQSTISKQISALEADLGVKLFNRDHQRVTLTAAGARLASDVDEYLEQYRTINERVRRLYIEIDQRLQIGMGPLEFAVLAPPLKLFVSRWPTIEVSCTVYTYQRLVRHLRAGTVDIAVGPRDVRFRRQRRGLSSAPPGKLGGRRGAGFAAVVFAARKPVRT